MFEFHGHFSPGEKEGNDPDFDSTQPIKKAFLRTYQGPKTEGNASIVCGHYTNVTQPGKHYVWLREPLVRDVSHFNYDCKYGNELTRNFADHLSQMSGNFLVLWLFGKYIGRHDSVTMEDRYNTVRKVLKEKFGEDNILQQGAKVKKLH